MTVKYTVRPARMGALLTKKQAGMCRKWSWSGAPGDHSPYPLDCVPYPGDDLLYCFLDIMTSYKVTENDVNLGPRGVTTDTSKYLQDLQCCYEEGFVLNQFVKVPGLRSTTIRQDWGEQVPYQAILSRTVTRDESKVEQWELHVEKQILSIKTLATDEFPQEHDMLQTIAEFAAKGARLVCAVPIGFVRSDSPNDQYTVMGVDLFFNIPHHLHPTPYMYHAIRLPIRYYIIPDVTQTIQQIDCDADWMGQMKVFLDQGWKLVDICIDTTALAEAFGMKSASRRIDSIWLFEKDKRLEKDTTPVFEGVIIEYLHKTGKGGELPCRDWRPVIAGMGVSGWELCTVLQTPYLVQSTFTTFTMKLLMIFQRPIYSSHQKLSKETRERMGNKPVLTYSRYGVSKSLPRDFLQATGASGTKGYYNQLLKRFVYDEEPGGSSENTDSTYKRSISSPAGSSIAPSSGSKPPSYHSQSPSESSNQASITPRTLSLQFSSSDAGSGYSEQQPVSPGSQTSSFLSTPPSTPQYPLPGLMPQHPNFSCPNETSNKSAPLPTQGQSPTSPPFTTGHIYREPSASLPTSPIAVPRHPENKTAPVPYIESVPGTSGPNFSMINSDQFPVSRQHSMPSSFSQGYPLSNYPHEEQTPRFPKASPSAPNYHFSHSTPSSPAIQLRFDHSSHILPNSPHDQQTPNFPHITTSVPYQQSSFNNPTSHAIHPQFPHSPHVPPAASQMQDNLFRPSLPKSMSTPVHHNFPSFPSELTSLESLYPQSTPSTSTTFPSLPSSPVSPGSPPSFAMSQHPQFSSAPSSPQVQPSPYLSPPIHQQLSSAPPSPVIAPQNRPPPVPQRRSSLSALPHRVPHRPPVPRRPRPNLPMANGYVPTGTGGTTYIRPNSYSRVYHSGVR